MITNRIVGVRMLILKKIIMQSYLCQLLFCLAIWQPNCKAEIDPESALNLGTAQEGLPNNRARMLIAMFSNPQAFTKNANLIAYSGGGLGFNATNIGPTYLLETIQMLDILIQTWKIGYNLEIAKSTTGQPNENKTEIELEKEYDSIVATPEARWLLSSYLSELKAFIVSKTLSAALITPVPTEARVDPDVTKACNFINILYQNLLAINQLVPNLFYFARPTFERETDLTCPYVGTFCQTFESSCKQIIENMVRALTTVFNIQSAELTYSQIANTNEYDTVIYEDLTLPSNTTTNTKTSVAVGISSDGSNINIMLSDTYCNLLLLDSPKTNGADAIFKQLSEVLPNILRRAFYNRALKQLLPNQTTSDNNYINKLAEAIQPYSVTTQAPQSPTTTEPANIINTKLSSNLQRTIDTVLNYYNNPFAKSTIANQNLLIAIKTFSGISFNNWNLDDIYNKVAEKFQKTDDSIKTLSSKSYENKDLKKLILELKNFYSQDTKLLKKSLQGKSLLENTLVIEASPQLDEPIDIISSIKSSVKKNTKALKNTTTKLAAVLFNLKKKEKQKLAKLKNPYDFLVDFVHHDYLSIKNTAAIESFMSKVKNTYNQVHSYFYTTDQEIYFSLLYDICQIMCDIDKIPLNILNICSYALGRMNKLPDVANGSLFIRIRSLNDGAKLLNNLFGKQKTAELFLENNFGIKKLQPFANFAQQPQTSTVTQNLNSETLHENSPKREETPPPPTTTTPAATVTQPQNTMQPRITNRRQLTRRRNNRYPQQQRARRGNPVQIRT